MADLFSTNIFRPLEVQEVSQSRSHHPRRRYLIEHAAGFTYERILKQTSVVIVLIAHPIRLPLSQPISQIVIKHYNTSPRHRFSHSGLHIPELEISTLPDPLVRRLLPTDLHVFPTLLSFQLYDTTLPKCYRAALFYKFYNGGTIHNLVASHWHRRLPIPEDLIWHVIARLTRAYSFLHTGRPTYQPHAADPNWDPIVHSDGHTSNVFLHYPSSQELHDDRSGVLDEVCRDGLPQVVLGDFGHAFSYSNDRPGEVASEVAAGAPEPATWRDKAQLGRVVTDMVTAMFGGKGEVDGSGGQKETVRKTYSEELVSVVDGFEPLVEWLNFVDDNGAAETALKLSAKAVDGFPGNEGVYGLLMGMADRKMEAFHAAKRQGYRGDVKEGGFMASTGL